MTLPSGTPFVTLGVAAFSFPCFGFGVAKNRPCYQATLAVFTVVLIEGAHEGLQRGHRAPHSPVRLLGLARLNSIMSFHFPVWQVPWLAG